MRIFNDKLTRIKLKRNCDITGADFKSLEFAITFGA